MNRIKKLKKDKYTQVANSFIRDNRISFKAKGLFAYMYSMDEDWNFTIKSIANQQKDGVDSIISAMNELKEYGYLFYEKRADGSGIYHLEDEPNTENPNLDFPNLGNSTPIKKEKLDKNTNDKKKIKQKENPPHQTSSNTQNPTSSKYRIFDGEDFLPREDIEQNNDDSFEIQVVDVEEIFEKPLEEKAIDYLNKLTGKKFSYTSGNTKEIKAQIKKGATEEQLKYVIDVKCSDWLNDDKMKKHLNPTTLFREANFDKYLNQDFDISGVVMDEYIRQRCEAVQNANK